MDGCFWVKSGGGVQKGIGARKVRVNYTSPNLVGSGQADDAQDAGKTSTNGRVKTQTAKESVRGW
jgi:hypothetical protein